MIRYIIVFVEFIKRLIVYPYRKLCFGCYCFHDYVVSVKHITMNSVYLDSYVYIGVNARIEGVTRYNNVFYYPRIILHRGVSIQQNCHITCAKRIEVGRNTAIAANVTITDINHPYTDVDVPIELQDIEVKEVVIGEDCKIYNGVVILPGVHIGKHVTIGANSVVTKDVSDYSVAVGAPAKVIKKFNFNKKEWIEV